MRSSARCVKKCEGDNTTARLEFAARKVFTGWTIRSRVPTQAFFCLSVGFETDQLGELKQKGTYFKLRVLEDEQAPVPSFDGKKVINLASNN